MWLSLKIMSKRKQTRKSLNVFISKREINKPEGAVNVYWLSREEFDKKGDTVINDLNGPFKTMREIEEWIAFNNTKPERTLYNVYEIDEK